MNALISGRAGRALLIDGDSLKSFEVDDPYTLTSRQQADLSYIFGEAADLRILENTTIEDVAIELRSSCNFTWALDLALISLDTELPKDIRNDAVEDLEELLATNETLDHVENILYAYPLPEDADIKGALELPSSAASSIAHKFLLDLKKFQRKISKVCRAWESIPTKTFGSYENREAFRSVAVCEGIFRVLAKEPARSISSFHRTSVSPGIEKLRNHDGVLREWYKLSHAAPHADSKKLNQIVAKKSPRKRRSLPDVSFEETVRLAEKSDRAELLDRIKSVAPTDVSILITGERGTDKELLAHVIHRNSKAAGPFIGVDCTSIAAELLEAELFEMGKSSKKRNVSIEAAKGGTLFLNGIEHLSISLQFQLLRVLETKSLKRAGRTKHIDFRLIAATNVDLEPLVVYGLFHSDLFYRLQEFTFVLTPLRQRNDIGFLASYFAKKAAQEFGLPNPKMEPSLTLKLSNYDWPGNIRELSSLMMRLVYFSRSSDLDLAFLPHWIKGEVPGHGRSIFTEKTGPVERELILEALKKTQGNDVRAARLLGISRRDLRKLLTNDRQDISYDS